MNIQYHYHVIKTLAIKAGIAEDKAERIAHYSQFIDDYNNVLSFIADFPHNANRDLVDFFTQHGYIKAVGQTKCIFKPATTGVHAFKSISDPSYQRQTLATYHFIPTRPLYELNPNADRGQYRCQTVQMNHLISNMMQSVFLKLIDTADNSPQEADALMEFGMVLHTYCDTYAHKGFSGLHGWENDAELMGSVNNLTRTEDMSLLDKMASIAPAVGHACIGHSPDSCNHTISYNVQKDGNDNKRSLHINDLNNTLAFMECAKVIYEKLCIYSKARGKESASWESFQAILQATMQQGQSNPESKLNTFWSNSEIGKGISYVYRKNRYFHLEQDVAEIEESLLLSKGFGIDDLKDFYSEKGEEARQLVGVGFTLLNDEFLRYNKLSYERMKAMNNTYPTGLTNHDLEMIKEEGI